MSAESPSGAGRRPTYHSRNRLLIRLGLCAAGGLLLGGVLALPFSGDDANVASPAATTVSAPAATVQGSAVALDTVAAPNGTDASVASDDAATAPSSTIRNGSAVATSTTSTSTSTSTALPNAGPSVDARAYVVMDADTGATLASSNPDDELPVGSVFKLLTAYVVMQAGDPTKVVTVPQLQLVADESQIYLRPGEQLPRDLLLRAMLIVSAGDAAETLAADVGGSQTAFVEQMNAATRSLGMAHTVAANPEGLDADGAHSSAADVAILARTLMADEMFRATVARRSANLHGATFPATNTLLGTYPGATGIKTGHTTAAGFCLAASATRNGRSLIVVVLGTNSIPARDVTAAALLNWGFDQPSG